MSIYGIDDVRTNDFNTYILSENDIIKLNCDINKRYD